ncbi:hypothetical protein B0H15DRAFT_788435 [Mycena belliarum]|uniref:Uncharacterized protein n=1 Tax=Mycena belliarum TaxID=1033014 RepID=A0AAD6TXL7_9AGAR|nr:hypothetical protein B0H15DRAFT_788435 [Mycena belliae]
MSADAKPLPLSGTLRDLALLRASGLDISSLVRTSLETQTPQSTADSTVERSYELVQQARAAIKIYNRGDVDNVGSGVEAIRTKVEELSKGLQNAHS